MFLLYFSALVDGFVPENIAHLAESALRFLELVQENNVNLEPDVSEDQEESLRPHDNYDCGNTVKTCSDLSKTFSDPFKIPSLRPNP